MIVVLTSTVQYSIVLTSTVQYSDVLTSTGKYTVLFFRWLESREKKMRTLCEENEWKEKTGVPADLCLCLIEHFIIRVQ